MNKIMIIGANWEQEPLLKEANEMGFYVIATNPDPAAEGFKYSDENYVADPRDLQKLDEIFQKTQPGAVIADACDYSMFAVAYLTNKYNLSGPNMDSLIITNNKYLQRKFADRGNIPQPKFRLCTTYDEVKAACVDLGLPVMLKPIDNRGSMGVCKVERTEDLKSAFFETLSNSHSRQMIVEEFILGKVVTVEGLYAGTFHNLSFSTKKMHLKFPSNAMHLQYPGDLPKSMVENLYSMNSALIEQIGINFGLTHSEFIVDEDKIYFLEIANRGGGVHVSNKIIPAITGINICEFLIRGARGNEIHADDFTASNRKYSILHFFDFGKGRVSKIKNVDETRNINGVLALRLNFKVGDYLGDVRTAINRPGFVIATADDLDICKSIISQVKNEMTIEFVKNWGSE
ncbi:MAG: ATP-grasp domain-containing protein [archaeon]|nr:ATP-grasp domain-containing protein [archaeon]